MKRVRVVVSGDVQGVGYRYTMRMVAREVGVTGWVRNRRDGSVEAEVEGSDEQVDEVLAWMAEGPPGSRVDSARVTDAEPQGDRRLRGARDGLNRSVQRPQDPVEESARALLLGSREEVGRAAALDDDAAVEEQHLVGGLAARTRSRASRRPSSSPRRRAP